MDGLFSSSEENVSSRKQSNKVLIANRQECHKMTPLKATVLIIVCFSRLTEPKLKAWPSEIHSRKTAAAKLQEYTGTDGSDSSETKSKAAGLENHVEFSSIIEVMHVKSIQLNRSGWEPWDIAVGSNDGTLYIAG